MPERTDLIYLCEQSPEGALCCIFDSYTRKEIPLDILPEGTPTLYPTHRVDPDPAHAARIWRSLVKLGGEVADWVRDAWYSCADGREWAILQFVRMAYRYGARAVTMLGEEPVAEMFALVRSQRNETHLMKEFMRFSDCGGALVSVIEPKCLVLEGMTPHFASRFPEETFMIFDKAHGCASFYRPYQWVVRPVEELDLPPADEAERNFRTLWRRYYDTIAIEGRTNPKCRMTHMYKRYWKNMFELDGETGIIRAEELCPLSKDDSSLLRVPPHLLTEKPTKKLG